MTDTELFRAEVVALKIINPPKGERNHFWVLNNTKFLAEVLLHLLNAKSESEELARTLLCTHGDMKVSLYPCLIDDAKAWLEKYGTKNEHKD